MSTSRHLIVSNLLLVFIIAFGTAGYMSIEGWSLIDSAYMTIITITTVGFGEIHSVSEAGRVYTIFLIFLGGGFFIYVVPERKRQFWTWVM